jgi:hypothetical protein
MSTNQYRGKEEAGKIDFEKLSPEEQRKYSAEHDTGEGEDEAVNEALAKENKEKLDRHQARRVH